MQVIVQGRNVQVTDRLREYVEDKVEKLDRFLGTITEARMELAVESTRSAEDRWDRQRPTTDYSVARRTRFVSRAASFAPIPFLFGPSHLLWPSPHSLQGGDRTARLD